MLKMYDLGQYNVPVVSWEQYVEGITVIHDCRQKIGVAYSWIDSDFAESIVVDDYASAVETIQDFQSRYGEDAIVVVMALPEYIAEGKMYVTSDTVALDTDSVSDVNAKQLEVYGMCIKNNLMSSKLVTLNWIVTSDGEVMFTGVE